jgi:hypothetical protein
VEDADLPEGASIESLEVDAGLEIQAVTDGVPGDPDGTRLEFQAVIRDDLDDIEWPYPSRAAASPPRGARSRTIARVGAVPYFAWAQREGLGMRVWLPTQPQPRSEGDSSTEGT